MMHDPELSDWIQDAIGRYTLATSDEPEYLKYYATLYNLLPIYPDWTHCYGLRADGTVFLFSTEDEEKTIHEETDERLRNQNTWLLTDPQRCEKDRRKHV
jgi:hypothetical protein